jgi:hypothetical protein
MYFLHVYFYCSSTPARPTTRTTAKPFVFESNGQQLSQVQTQREVQINQGEGIRVEDSPVESFFLRNEPQWAMKNSPFAELTNQDRINLYERQSLADERLKRNPSMYTFQPDEPDKESWTINVGFIEENAAAVKPSWSHGLEGSVNNAGFKQYGYDQGKTFLLLIFL